MRWKPFLSSTLASAFAFGLFTGCAHVGPKTISVDRFDYSTTIADSWKQQTLLNIVKLRYMDLPVFVDVASIVAGYSIETGGTMGVGLPETTQLGGNTVTLAGSSRFTDRPTITYVPLTGEKFLRGLITPIDPKNIFAMVQSGYAADFVLGLTLESLNGVHNRSSGGDRVREADPDFIRALELMRDVQAAGAVGLSIETDKAKGSTGVVFFRHEGVSDEIKHKSGEVRRLLKLPAEQDRFNLIFSPLRGKEDELAVISRSMLQILGAFSTYVDVPTEDLEAHRVMPPFENMPPSDIKNGVRIFSGKDKPNEAFTAVRYRGSWFWVDDGDWQTKRALSTIIFLFTLSATGGDDKLPVITIPAQ
jgi:hypothetical protein